VEITRVSYADYSDHESVTIFCMNPYVEDHGTVYSVWKKESKSKWETFDSDTTGKLFEILSWLSKRLSNDVAPNEEMAIKTLGRWLPEVLKGRLNASEETRTRRNKLVRYLRKEIERLRK